MKKDKKDFLSADFYEYETSVLTVFNQLLETKSMKMDHYTSGEFLSAWVPDNDRNRQILSQVITNFDEYKIYNETIIGLNKKEEIQLSGLQELHRNHFGAGDEIMWDKENEVYTLRCILESWDDDDE